MNDVMFRSAVAGFNKEDVLNYIEDLKKEQENNSKIISDSRFELSNAFKKINDIEKQLIEYKQTIDELSLENDQYRSIINRDDGFNPNASSFEIADEIIKLKAENQLLKESANELRNECEKYKENERQFESLITDAYIYSENILDDAREKADKITSGIKNSIENATENIGDFSEYANNISTGFSEIVSQLEVDLKHLSESLMSVSKGFQTIQEEKIESSESDINIYIEDSQQDECATNSCEENQKDLTSFIKKFESMISGKPDDENDMNNDFIKSNSDLQNTTQENEVVEAVTENIDDIQVADHIEYAEHNMDDLIGEYTSEEALDISEQPQEDIKVDVAQDALDQNVQANFISSAPIGSLRNDTPLENPLNSCLRFDENFNIQGQHSPSEPEVSYGSQPLESHDNEEPLIPLQRGMDYSDIFDYDNNDSLQLSTDEQFNSMVNEYASNETDNQDFLHLNNDLTSNPVDASTVTSKTVEVEVSEPVMVDPNGLFKSVEEPSGKVRFGQVKIKIRKDK